jgi:hypothetical protein
MSLKKVIFLVASTTASSFNSLSSNIFLAKEFLLLIPHSYNEQETDNISVQKKENRSLIKRMLLGQYN